jgi:hypothetical protein
MDNSTYLLKVKNPADEELVVAMSPNEVEDIYDDDVLTAFDLVSEKGKLSDDEHRKALIDLLSQAERTDRVVELLNTIQDYDSMIDVLKFGYKNVRKIHQAIMEDDEERMPTIDQKVAEAINFIIFFYQYFFWHSRCEKRILPGLRDEAESRKIFDQADEISIHATEDWKETDDFNFRALNCVIIYSSGKPESYGREPSIQKKFSDLKFLSEAESAVKMFLSYINELLQSVEYTFTADYFCWQSLIALKCVQARIKEVQHATA